MGWDKVSLMQSIYRMKVLICSKLHVEIEEIKGKKKQKKTRKQSNMVDLAMCVYTPSVSKRKLFIAITNIIYW